MSRVAKKPVALPKGVELNIQPNSISAKGPKGTLSLLASPPAAESRSTDRRRHAVFSADDAALIAAHRHRCAPSWPTWSRASSEVLRAQARAGRRRLPRRHAGQDLNLSLGFSHPVLFKAPEGITITTPTQTEILVQGTDKQRVGRGCRQDPRLPSAGALQGQGCEVRRRSHHSQGSQEGLIGRAPRMRRPDAAFSFPRT